MTPGYLDDHSMPGCQEAYWANSQKCFRGFFFGYTSRKLTPGTWKCPPLEKGPGHLPLNNQNFRFKMSVFQGFRKISFCQLIPFSVFFLGNSSSPGHVWRLWSWCGSELPGCGQPNYHVEGWDLEILVPWKLTRWWFQIFFFSPLLGEMIQFDDHIFQMGWNHQLANMFFLKIDGTGGWFDIFPFEMVKNSADIRSFSGCNV